MDKNTENEVMSYIKQKQAKHERKGLKKLLKGMKADLEETNKATRFTLNSDGMLVEHRDEK